MAEPIGGAKVQIYDIIYDDDVTLNSNNFPELSETNGTGYWKFPEVYSVVYNDNYIVQIYDGTCIYSKKPNANKLYMCINYGYVIKTDFVISHISTLVYSYFKQHPNKTIYECERYVIRYLNLPNTIHLLTRTLFTSLTDDIELKQLLRVNNLLGYIISLNGHDEFLDFNFDIPFDNQLINNGKYNSIKSHLNES